MTRGQTLVLFTAGPRGTDAPALEGFLRLAVGLAAGDHPLDVALLDEPGPLTPTAETYWDALVEAGVVFTPVEADTAPLRARLRACDRVLRLGAAERTATPALLVLDQAYLGSVSDEDLRQDLRQAGQIIRIRAP